MTRCARSIHLTAGRQSLSCTAVVSLLLMLVAGCASSSAPKPDPSGADPLIEAQAAEAHRLISPAIIHDEQINAYLAQVGKRLTAATNFLDAEGSSAAAAGRARVARTQFFLVDAQNDQVLNAFTT